MVTLPRDNSFSIDINKGWKENRSSKLRALHGHIQKVIEKGDKCIVYSQWTTMLNLIEKDLEVHQLEYCRLDGSMSQKKRAKVLSEFRANADLHIFLISLKAGGVGLNLISANHVFLVDPWWNPAVEDQAINRVHRIGQNKPVHVTRLICRETIEQRVLELNEKKKLLI